MRSNTQAHSRNGTPFSWALPTSTTDDHTQHHPAMASRMNRRDLLRLAATLPALTLGGRLFAAPASPARFLLVFLRGGYDCANLLIPYSSSYYYETRPHIAIARPDAPGEHAALALDAN